jgi:transposase-like protein
MMTKRLLSFAVVTTLFCSRAALAQFPVVDAVADKVIQKYQQSSCEQLWAEKTAQQGRPKPQREQEAVQMLRANAQMRAAFIDRVAAPVANKMFECGMMP